MELLILMLTINFALKLMGVRTLYLIIGTIIFGALMTFISNIAPREYHDIYEHGIESTPCTIRISNPHPLDKHIMDILFIPISGFAGLALAYCILINLWRI